MVEIKDTQQRIDTLLDGLRKRNPEQTEFLQAVEEVVTSLYPILNKKPEYFSRLESLIEPDRTICFRVPWMDSKGVHHVNRGYRVQFNNTMGPYKGGLRFHHSVKLSLLKFLGFEQIFKNALTGLQMGGAKGGSDFDPHGKSDEDVRLFCQAFMTRLAPYIGPDVDVPAGDIGVGGREIGYLYGQYRLLTNSTNGTLTGKGIAWGGSRIRPEATGYGAVYMAELMFKDMNKSLKNTICYVSGSGNVAQYACEKLLELGATVCTISDSQGTVYFPNGITKVQLEYLFTLKNTQRERLSKFQQGEFKYIDGKQPWLLDESKKCEVSFPCATQNEIGADEANWLTKHNCKAVVEAANMPCNNEAIEIFKKAGVQYAPGKAANAGGVAVSGMEMSQNAGRVQWSREEVDRALKNVMTQIYEVSKTAAAEYGVPGDLQMGANIAAFETVVKTMEAQGLY